MSASIVSRDRISILEDACSLGSSRIRDGYGNHELLNVILTDRSQGTLTGSVVTIIVLSCFRKAIRDDGKYNELDAIWRI
jgi:hypothetical protein